MSKQAFTTNFQFIKILLMPKNECVALIAYNSSAASNIPENGGHDL